MSNMAHLLLATVVVVTSVCSSASAGQIWVKGNTHTHTNQSDGDSTSEVVIDWYRSHGYQFLVITDHNKLTQVSSDGIIMIPGEEVSAGFADKPVHVNAIGITQSLAPTAGKDMRETIQGNVDLVAGAGGLAQINHPNWRYPFDHRELSQITNCGLLEVYNASSGCNDAGDNAHISTEQIWDVLLSKGKTFHAVASDDAHCYTRFEPAADNPGRAWVMVRVKKLDQASILDSLRSGDFYASTGVELADHAFDGKTVRLAVKPEGDTTYRVRFIGLHGQILKEIDGPKAEYKLSGAPSEAYVRAKVIASSGAVAWTQPVTVKR